MFRNRYLASSLLLGVVALLAALTFSLGDGTAGADTGIAGTTPPGEEVVFGDLDCDGDVDPQDILVLLRDFAIPGRGTARPTPIPNCDDGLIHWTGNTPLGDAGALGEEPSDGPVHRKDLNCSHGVDEVDVMPLLWHTANLLVSQLSDCPQPGDEVTITNLPDPSVIPFIGIDTTTADNTATHVGVVDDCIRVAADEDFVLDLVVKGVPPYNPATGEGGLARIKYAVDYRHDIVDLFSWDPHQFLDQIPGSVLFDKLKDYPPYWFTDDLQDVSYQTEESGDGVLVRLVMHALTEGTTRLSPGDFVFGPPINANGSPPDAYDGLGNEYTVTETNDINVVVGNGNPLDPCTNISNPITPSPTPTLAPPAAIPFLGLDFKRDDNTATSVGQIADCLEDADHDELTTVDLVVKGVPSVALRAGLSGFHLGLEYDGAGIEVQSYDIDHLLAAKNPAFTFNPTVVADVLPDDNGDFQLEVHDTSSFYESGEGVLATLTLHTAGSFQSSLHLLGNTTVFDRYGRSYGISQFGDADLHVLSVSSTPNSENTCPGTPVPTLPPCSGVTPTPTPTPTATPAGQTPSATNSASPTPSPCSSKTPTPTPSPDLPVCATTPSPSPTPTGPTQTPTPTSTPSPTPNPTTPCKTPTPTPIVTFPVCTATPVLPNTPSGCITRTPTPTASPTPTVTPTLTPTPTPTATPTPTPTPGVTATPTPFHCEAGMPSPTAIPDDDTFGVDVHRTLVGGGANVNSVAICLDISHPWMGDLKVTLSHGAITETIFNKLTNGNGTCDGGGLGMHAYISDNASDPPLLADCDSPFDGYYRAQSPLIFGEGSFHNEPVAGDWYLTVTDLSNEHGTGTITGFEVYAQ